MEWRKRVVWRLLRGKVRGKASEQKLKSNSSSRAERGLVVLSWQHGVVTEPNGPHSLGMSWELVKAGTSCVAVCAGFASAMTESAIDSNA